MSSAVKPAIDEASVVKDERLDNGSIIHWTERVGDIVLVTCGGAHIPPLKRLVPVKKAKDKKRFTGICKGCAKKFFHDETLEKTGSVIMWGKRNPENPVQVMVKCGKGGELHFLYPPSHQDRRGYSGYCPKHSKGKYSGIQNHHSGAIIDWDRREPNRPDKVAYKCAGWCGLWKYCESRSAHNPKWSGLCQECRKRRGSPRKHTRDVELKSGVVLHFGQPDPNDPRRMMVTCICGSDWSALRDTVIDSYLDESWDGYCHERKLHNSRLRLLTQKEKQQGTLEGASSLPLKIKEKHPRKPPAEISNKPPAVLGKTIDDLNAVILKLYDSLSVSSEVTARKVAAELGVGRLGHGDEGQENIRRLLRLNKVKERFPHYRDKLIAACRPSMSHATEGQITPQNNDDK